MDGLVCFKCHRPCDDSLSVAYRFYHPSCFSCEDCQNPLAYNYHIADDRVLCERDYQLRRGIVCKKCLRPITSSDETTMHSVGRYKYHDGCMKCAVCKRSSSSKKQPQEWFIHNDQPFCRHHYSLLHAPICPGCQQAVLSKPAATDIHWHHECFMIQKYWNIRLATEQLLLKKTTGGGLFAPSVEEQLRKVQSEMDQRRRQVWEEMRAFEDSLATCIWDMALHVTARSVAEGLQMASQLTWHLKVLLTAHQAIHENGKQQESECDALCRNVCLQVIQFYGSVHKQSEVPKQVISFVANLAADLKTLLRTGLLEALHSDQDRALDMFLSPFLHLRKHHVWVSGRYWFQGPPFDFSRSVLTGEVCPTCDRLIDTACFRFGRSARWHTSCLVCRACRSHISEPQKARIGRRLNSGSNNNNNNNNNNKQQRLSSHPDLMMLCENCTRNPCNRRDHVMQQHPLVKVSQIEQCLFLLCISLARVQDYKMMFTKGTRLLDNEYDDEENQPVLLRRTLTATTVRGGGGKIDQVEIKPTANKKSVGVRRALSAGRQPKPEPIQISSSNPRTLVELTYKQDFVVRHLAVVLCLESKLISMEDASGLLHVKKATSLWSKLKKTTLRSTAPASSMQAYKTFGVPLTSQQFLNPDWAIVQALADKYPAFSLYFSSCAQIPPIVQNCILALMESDMRVEGLFRKNGNFRELNEACAKIDAGERYWEYLKKAPAVQLAALLKRFFRDLPEPLLTYKFRRVFLAAIRMESLDETKRILHFACCMLPKPNRDVMFLLFTFLNYLVTHFGDVTLMHTDNIARVFTPSIFYPEQQEHRNTSPEDIAVVKLLISNVEKFCKIPEDFIGYLKDKTMIKLLSTNDVTSSKEFLRICGNIVRLSKNSGDKATTRSAVVLPTSTTSSSSSSVATAPPPPPNSAKSAKSMQTKTMRRSIWSDL